MSDFKSALEKARAVAAKLSQGSMPAAPVPQPNLNTSTVNYTNTINNGSTAPLKRQLDDDDTIVGNLKKMAYGQNTSLTSNNDDKGGSKHPPMPQNHHKSQQHQQNLQRSNPTATTNSNGNTIFKPSQIYLDGVIINGEKILDCLLPGNKVGFVIGKNGDMIRQLQERANVKMVVIQQSSEVSEGQKQLRISGDPTKVDHAHQLVKDLLIEKEMEMLKYSQKSKPHSHSNNHNEYGPSSHNNSNYLEIPVSPQYIGLVIGKSGENIKRISQETGAKVTVDVSKTDSNGNKLCQITGSNSNSINIAADMVRDILNNAMNNKRTPQAGSEEVKISVPQNKTGIVIGKGGETIRQLKQQAGCNIELEKNSKGIFNIRGTAERVQYAQQLIGEKIGGQQLISVLSSTIQNNQQTANAYTDPYSWAAAAQFAYPQMPANSTPTAAASATNPATQDTSAAWAAYYSQYYSQMQQMAAQQLPATAAAPTTQTVATQPATTAAVATQAADGQEDFSAQWAAYYRYYGMEKEAEVYEQMAKQKKQSVAQSNPAPTCHSDKLEGEIDLNEENGFNVSKYSKDYFLTPLPLNTIRTVSYPIRQPNPFSINSRPNEMKPDMAYTKAYLHTNTDNTTRGLIQFRQLSDMWLTEIKGVTESLESNSSYLLVVHQNPTSQVGNKLCENAGQPFHYSPVNVNLRDIRQRNALGDLGIFPTNKDGIGLVNLHAIYTSLFGGPGTILGRSLGVYKIKGEEVILNPVLCGDIKLPNYAPANFQVDQNAPALRRLNTTARISTTTTPVPDFEKPPFF